MQELDQKQKRYEQIDESTTPRSGNKMVYVSDNQSSRPPPAFRGRRLSYAVSLSSPKLRLTAMGPGGEVIPHPPHPSEVS
jgi:hypothetical protein